MLISSLYNVGLEDPTQVVRFGGTFTHRQFPWPYIMFLEVSGTEKFPEEQFDPFC